MRHLNYIVMVLLTALSLLGCEENCHYQIGGLDFETSEEKLEAYKACLNSRHEITSRVAECRDAASRLAIPADDRIKVFEACMQAQKQDEETEQ